MLPVPAKSRYSLALVFAAARPLLTDTNPPSTPFIDASEKACVSARMFRFAAPVAVPAPRTSPRKLRRVASSPAPPVVALTSALPTLTTPTPTPDSAAMAVLAWRALMSMLPVPAVKLLRPTKRFSRDWESTLMSAPCTATTPTPVLPAEPTAPRAPSRPSFMPR